MKKTFLCLITLCVVLSVIFTGCTRSSSMKDNSGDTQSEKKAADYESTLFDTGFVHQIDVHISDKDWTDLLKNPTDKTKYKVDINIDGEEVKDVAFSTKGNSSLYFVADDPKSDRYSFKVNFGKYVEGQTFHGLNKLNMNNSYKDSTYMEDHFSYKLFREAGVPSPLTSYAWVCVNGQDRGLYLLVEDESEAFLDREFEGKGEIYKPESDNLSLKQDDIKRIKENGLKVTEECRGADFVYADDDPESYADIFNNAETDDTTTDKAKVIQTLKNLSEEKNLDQCLDTDEIIAFFAAHNFLLNYDSYTGSMLHNIVLHEKEGVFSLIPWDYNFAFGTFIPVIGKEALKDATNILNQGIDSPLIGTVEEKRPMWKWIVNNENYLKVYHEKLDTLVNDYFISGEYDTEINDLFEMLLPYVEKDPTAFFTADEYKKGCQVLKEFCLRRAESIRRQLNGNLATVNESQSDDDKVDASDLVIKDMGVANIDLD